jgi:hypothetical protein
MESDPRAVVAADRSRNGAVLEIAEVITRAADFLLAEITG